MTKSTLLDDLGDIGEYGEGDYTLLPASFYIMSLGVDDPEVSPVGGANGDRYQEDENGEVRAGEDGLVLAEGKPLLIVDGEPVLAGGSPYLTITVTAEEGPFEECGFSSRFYFTPGKGPNIGFVNHAVKAVTGRAVDLTALAKSGIAVEGNNAIEKQQSLRLGYLRLSAEDRLDLMAQYCRFDLWDGGKAVVKVGREKGQKEGQVFNRIQGFYALTDGKKGQGFVRSKCHENQEAVGIAEGTLEVDDAATA